MSTVDQGSIQDIDSLRALLRQYYGSHLKTNADLSQKACCTDEGQKQYSHIYQLIPDEVKEKYYGCGCPVPQDDLTALTVLDLGCGTGLDAFLLSYLVGKDGKVIGIDMTPQQLDVARRNTGPVMDRYRYQQTNVFFNEDLIEVAETVADNSIDLVVSNCVLNLSPRKDLVLRTIFRVLKEGGEMYVSDIVSDRRLPAAVRNDPQLIAECLGGAEYEHDWFELMEENGFRDARVVSRRQIQNEAHGIPIVFTSLTMRCFKFSEPLDRRCEDYGQIAIYQGSVAGCRARFALDDHHIFEAGKPTPVCRNTARMLTETRLARHFTVSLPGDHFGLFPCGPTSSSNSAGTTPCC